MNIVLLHEDDRRGGGAFRLSGARARHIREVLRAAPGDSVRVGLLEGPLGTATVASIEGESVELDAVFEAHAPPRPTVDLVLAIPRPKALRRLLPQLAALGVDRLVLLRTWRVAKPYLTARALDPAVYRPLLHDGLMQARSTREPRVTVEPLFRPFVEDRAPALVDGAAAIVAHPTASARVSSLSPGTSERVVVAVGPEGGFIPYEIEMLAAAGFSPVSMGERTLRVETACVALLAQLDLLRSVGGGRCGARA